MKKRSIAIVLSLLLVLLLLPSCGGSSSGGSGSYSASSVAQSADSAAYYGAEESTALNGESKAYWDAPAEEAEAPASDRDAAEDDASAKLPAGVKMVYRANMELESTEFDQSAAGISELVKELGGYFEEQSLNNRSSGYRSANYTVRIPAARFETFLHQVGDICHIRYQTQSAENISEVYYDSASRLETSRIKLKRLQELLERAEEMEDIITLESAISETEYQIESLSGELRHYDSLVDYSTVYVSLQEVYRVTEDQPTPMTFGQRLSGAFTSGLRDFGRSLEDFAEGLAYSWLPLLTAVLVVVLAVKLIRRLFLDKNPGKKKGGPLRKLRRKKDSAASDEAPAEPPEAGGTP